ncbi:hypothetical protein [Streptomyces sp. NRRL S-244]|uniref:hypothetical protein n=1 Tax=Streptomyces sp. NRRL S-244 TaxID=1463897 RepID=UPI00131A55FC|nr:hypothetical protein [Streptomyces sp. NRRL S-244]
MSTARERLMSKHQDEAHSWLQRELAKPVPSEDEYDSDVRLRWLEVARSHDPGASLTEELMFRLRGDAASAGGLDLGVGGLLLKPLQEMITAAAERNVKLLLVGVSPGSTVLHFQPQEAGPITSETETTPGQVIEGAVRKIHTLFEAADNGRQAENWGDTEKHLGDLARVLSKFDLTADLRWLDGGGGVVSSSLTERGRDNVKTWHAHVPEATPPQMSITGHIATLDKSTGVAKVKTGPSRKSKAYAVHFDPGDLVSLRLTLDQHVTFTVEERTKIKRDGTVVTETYFVSWNGQQ